MPLVLNRRGFENLEYIDLSKNNIESNFSDKCFRRLLNLCELKIVILSQSESMSVTNIDNWTLETCSLTDQVDVIKNFYAEGWAMDVVEQWNIQGEKIAKKGSEKAKSKSIGFYKRRVENLSTKIKTVRHSDNIVILKKTPRYWQIM